MTVDRLAALEAVAKAARPFARDADLQSAHNDDCDIAKGRCICGLSKLAAAFAALDAASPLTTPTPDHVMMAESKEATHRRFYEAFHAWFMQSHIDFWSEADAPEELATIAVEIYDRRETAQSEGK